MERKIKFRGKSLRGGKWVYGDLMSNICGTRIVRYTETDNGAKKRADWEYIDVDPSTIGQFTGLTDSAGKEIYEGDIVIFYDEIEECYEESSIKYNTEYCSFVITNNSDDPMTLSCHAFYTICGNIHDNNQPTAI